jgi:hypothetical protein
MNGVTPPFILYVFMAYRKLILPSLSLATDTSVSCFVTEEAVTLKDTVLLQPESAGKNCICNIHWEMQMTV